eukprot:763418-Hanusia_phi.AAC.24
MSMKTWQRDHIGYMPLLVPVEALVQGEEAAYHIAASDISECHGDPSYLVSSVASSSFLLH